MLEEREFERIRSRTRRLADRLGDTQILDLADLLHEALRERRSLRARHPRVAPEPRSFLHG